MKPIRNTKQRKKVQNTVDTALQMWYNRDTGNAARGRFLRSYKRELCCFDFLNSVARESAYHYRVRAFQQRARHNNVTLCSCFPREIEPMRRLKVGKVFLPSPSPPMARRAERARKNDESFASEREKFRPAADDLTEPNSIHQAQKPIHQKTNQKNNYDS